MLPEFYHGKGQLDHADFEDDHFGKRKMLAEEPEQALYAGSHGPKGSEEEKFEKAADFDKNLLTKKFPSLALPNAPKNKEEIDLLDDLIDIEVKEESKVQK